MKLTGALFGSVLLVLCLDASAQQIKNVHADFDGEKVIISYDLVAEHSEDKFTVTVFSSHDDFRTPLALLVGNAGENVAPGESHKITWDAKSSLPADINKDLVFKIKAKVTVGIHHPSRLEVKPLHFTSFKRGGKLNMEWNGGIEGEPIAIELYKSNKLVKKISETNNANMFSWSIPKKTKTGKGYSIRISKASDPAVNAVSQSFEIKPKMSLLVKLIPVAVVGGVIAILASAEEEDPDLPGPVTP
jgi:hypothetical protein